MRAAIACAIFTFGILQVGIATRTDASEMNARYTWMLPKTVIDVSVRYDFVNCNADGRIEFNITPTLTVRSIPDPKVGLVSVELDPLKSFWQNSYVQVGTYERSHILKSIGSQPSSAVNAIFSNIVSGVTSLVATRLGVAGGAKFTANDLKDQVKNEEAYYLACGDTKDDRATIDVLKGQIRIWQNQSTAVLKSLNSPNSAIGNQPSKSAAPAGTAKSDTGNSVPEDKRTNPDATPSDETTPGADEGNKIEKAQKTLKNLDELIKNATDKVTALESRLTFTLELVIDPAYPINRDGTVTAGIGADGNIARIALYEMPEVLHKQRWFKFMHHAANTTSNDDTEYAATGTDSFFSPESRSKELAIYFAKADSRLKHDLTLNIYLDLLQAHPRITLCPKCRRQETSVRKDAQYREVVYIPVSVYRGDHCREPPQKNVLKLECEIIRTIGASESPASPSHTAPTPSSRGSSPPPTAGGASAQPKALTSQLLPFPQFGAPRALPVIAAPFESLKWSITFAESGEIISADFSSASIGAQMTQFFATAAGARNTIAAEERAAANLPNPDTQRLTAQNSALKAQIDNINYRNQLNALKAQGFLPQ